MAEIAKVYFNGKSGQSYEFTVYPANTKFNDVGAAYIFGHFSNTPQGIQVKALYIGETGKLGQRIPNHEKWGCVNERGCNCICIHLENGDNQRLAIEKDLLDAGKPVCND